MDMFSFAADGIACTLDLRVGHIAGLDVEQGGRTLRPLHRAPWLDEPAEALPPELPEGTKYLSGDFLCAPFSASDVEAAPLHGWPANSRWDVAESGPVDVGWQARFRLRKPVLGATVDKVLTLRHGHPFLYQEHLFTGGSGRLPVAHHPMTAMREGGIVAFSAKRLAFTPDLPLEPDPARGRYMLAYPGETHDLAAFPRRDGATYDLTGYPADGSAEDFVTLVEAEGGRLGWTAVARTAERDLVLVLKNPAELPVTMLWISNGGRDYAPWSGRHRGVLGIEDGRTAVGHRASIGDNRLARMGVKTAFELQPEGTVSVRHVIGAMALESRATPPASIEPAEDVLRLVFGDGGAAQLPFDGGFLGVPL